MKQINIEVSEHTHSTAAAAADVVDVFNNIIKRRKEIYHMKTKCIFLDRHV
jgi:hypothetical protein